MSQYREKKVKIQKRKEDTKDSSNLKRLGKGCKSKADKHKSFHM